MEMEKQLNWIKKQSLKCLISFFVCFLVLFDSVNAQEDLEEIIPLFPTSIETFSVRNQPEIAKVRVNGKDYYNIVQRYAIDIDTVFTVRLNDYSHDPAFIKRMSKEIRNSSPFENESEIWKNLELLGCNTQMQVIKKYPTYNFTTVVTEKYWLITFSGNGINEDQAIKYLTIILESLLIK